MITALAVKNYMIIIISPRYVGVVLSQGKLQTHFGNKSNHRNVEHFHK